MCGIAGIINSQARNYLPQMNKMLRSLKHRGPDGNRITTFKNCLLGHTRLSIIDLSTGDQPMKSSCSSKTIVFNGEIYGYKDLKNSVKNYKFITNSDTEVILALYEKYGSQLPKYLPGAFSFAIYDPDSDSLFCARDRFGEKPFYYAIGDRGEFIFSSEIKAILASGLISPILDRSSLSYYIKHLYVHPTKTIYKNVGVLPAGSSLYLKKGEIKINRYWDIPPEIKISEADAVNQFSLLFNKAVEEQLIADVPVGILLSGGLDSTTVTAVASQYQKKIKTFSFGFTGLLNELSYARAVAKQYRTEHYEYYESDVKVGDLLCQMQEIYDEPFADSSNIPNYLINKLASKQCKVVLGGDGGDEMLLGYDWYKPFAGLTLNRPITCIKSLFIRNISKLHDSQNSYFTDNDIIELGLPVVDNFSYFGLDAEKVNQVQRIDSQNYLPGDILVKIDRASMANSLEVRAPFLNFQLAEFCLSLPSYLKLKNGQSKLLLRQSFSKYFPEVIKIRSKQGFGAPVKDWLARSDVIKLKDSIIKDKHHKIFHLFPKELTIHYLNQLDYQGWIILNTALWLETHDFRYE